MDFLKVFQMVVLMADWMVLYLVDAKDGNLVDLMDDRMVVVRADWLVLRWEHL